MLKADAEEAEEQDADNPLLQADDPVEASYACHIYALLLYLLPPDCDHPVAVAPVRRCTRMSSTGAYRGDGQKGVGDRDSSQPARGQRPSSDFALSIQTCAASSPDPRGLKHHDQTLVLVSLP